MLTALSNITNSFDCLVDRLDRQETRLVAIEEKLSSHSSCSSSSPDSAKKTRVPLPVRVCCLTLMRGGEGLV